MSRFRVGLVEFRYLRSLPARTRKRLPGLGAGGCAAGVAAGSGFRAVQAGLAARGPQPTRRGVVGERDDGESLRLLTGGR